MVFAQVWSKQMAEKLINPPKRSNTDRVSSPPVETAVRSAPPLPPRSPPARKAPPEPLQRAPSPPPDATCDATKWLGTIFARPDSITARLNDSKKGRGVGGCPPSQRVQSPHPVEVNSDRAPSPRAEATQGKFSKRPAQTQARKNPLESQSADRLQVVAQEVAR